MLSLRPLGWTLLASVGVVSVALAAGWSPWASAFPTNPCADGWTGCLVEGAAVTPGVARDAVGRPVVSGSRVGWFDLAPTASFSPFVGLSPYAVSAPVEAPSEPVADVAAPPAPMEPVAVAAPNPIAAAPIAEPRPVAAPIPTPAPAPQGGSVRPSNPTPVSVAPPVAVPAPVAPAGSVRPSNAVVTPPPAATVRPPAAVVTPPPPAASVRPPAAVVTPPPVVVPPPVVTPPPAAAVASASASGCDDLVKLEPAAMMGQLNVGQSKCLDGRIGSEPAQTMKDKVSRLLIANADAKGDKSEWERLLKRHLEDIDRSDPDMCFRYALQLSRGGAGRAMAVIKWADYALENKSKWSGSNYKTRVANLHKLRSEAMNKLWQEAETTYTTNRTDENEQRAARYRGQAKDMSKEWLDYARSSQQDTKAALALCVSAAGNRAFCEG